MKDFVRFIILFLMSQCCFAEQWATLSFVTFNDAQRSLMRYRNSIIVKKELSSLATQILFSWNVIRPSKGKYLFSMQVYDATTQRWSNWARIAEWGKGIQRSFEQSIENNPSFFYVRWQMPKGHVADKCRVKIESFGGASLGLVYRLSFAAVHYPSFVSERGNSSNFSLPSIAIKHMPAISQMEAQHRERNRICSPTSLSMVVSYLNGKYEAPESFAEDVYDYGLETYGSWPFNVAHAFDRSMGHFYFSVARLNSFAELHDYLRKRLPVVVSVRGPLKTMPEGKTYREGHLLVIVGWDNSHKKVICFDPAFASSKDVLHAYDINEFLKAWENSGRLAYVIEPRD